MKDIKEFKAQMSDFTKSYIIFASKHFIMKQQVNSVNVHTRDNLFQVDQTKATGAWAASMRKIRSGMTLNVFAMESANGYQKGSFLSAVVRSCTPIISNGRQRVIIHFDDSRLNPPADDNFRSPRNPLRYE